MHKNNKIIVIDIIIFIIGILILGFTIININILKKLIITLEERDNERLIINTYKVEEKQEISREINEENIKNKALKIAGQIEKDFEKAKEISIEKVYNKNMKIEKT